VEAGWLRKFGFHAIRHLSASILAREKVDIPTIQALCAARARPRRPATCTREASSKTCAKAYSVKNKRPPGRSFPKAFETGFTPTGKSDQLSLGVPKGI